MFPMPALAEKLHSFLYRTHIIFISGYFTYLNWNEREIKPVIKASPETTNTNSERKKN